MLNPELIQACESFSEGDAEPVLPYLSDTVIWEIIGDRSIEGRKAVQEFCAEMSESGHPELRNSRTSLSESRIFVEGIEKNHRGIFYCDSYSITEGKVSEIRSYCICTIAEESTGDSNGE